MADNPQVRAGTAGGTITVAADEVTIYGAAAQLQGVKIHDGAEGGTVGAKVSTAGELHTWQANSGTVTVGNTVAAWVNTAGTVSVSNPVAVWVNTAGTVNSGTLLGQAGTVNVANTVATWSNNAGTVTIGGVSTGDALEVWVNTAGTVTANSGTLLGQAGTVNVANTVAVWGSNTGTVAAWVNTAGTVASLPGGLTGYAEDTAHTTGDVGLQALSVRKGDAAATSGSDGDYQPLVTDSSGALWTHINAGTVTATPTGTQAVWVNTAGTVSVSNTVPVWVNTAGTVTANSGTLLGQAGTVTIGGVSTGDALEVWTNNSGTVAAWVNTAGTVASLPGGLTGYAEDAGHTTGDIGLQSLTVRKGDAAALAGSENDYQPLITSAAGALWVHVNAGTVTATPTGTQAVWVNTAGTVSVSNTVPVWVNTAGTVSVSNLAKNEDDPHSTGDVGVQALAVRKGDAVAVSGSDGDYNPLTVNSVGALWTHVNAGTVTVGNTVPVWSNNSGTVAAWVNTAGTVASLPGGLTGYAEDAGHSTGDIGLQALSVRKGDAAATSGAENDYQPLITDSVGALWTHVNAGTVTIGGIATGDALEVWGNNSGTVAAWVNTAGTVSVSNLAKNEDTAHSTGDAGIQTLAVRKDTPAALADTDADYAPLEVNPVGGLWTHEVPSGTATHSSTAGTVTMGTLLAANTARYGFSVHNDTDNVLYLRCGPNAASTAYTVRMVSQSHYEVPFRYTGIVTGIWTANGGSAHVAEFKAS